MKSDSLYAPKKITEAIGLELIGAADSFTNALVKALDDASKFGLPESWKTAWDTADADTYPKRAFRDTALVILAGYREDLSVAIKDLKNGQWHSIWEISSMYKGLSKQMDYNFDWMTPENKEFTLAPMDDLVGVACEVSRLGHEQSNREQN